MCVSARLASLGGTVANTLSTERHDPQSPADWRDHITRYEYVIVHHTVPEENFAGTIEDIWGQTGADPNDPDTWDRRDIIRPVGMVEMYHYQSTRNNRQHAKLCEAFRAIRSTDGLAVSIERVGFKSPGDPTTRIPR